MKKYTTPYIELDVLYTNEDVLVTSDEIAEDNKLPTIWL